MPDYDIDSISDVIHSRLRLGVMAYLANADTASLTVLKTALKVTQGNLSVQVRELEDTGFIDVEKCIEGRKPLTTARPTDTGRRAFEKHLDALSGVLGDALKR